jgi:HEAT repeat protein
MMNFRKWSVIPTLILAGNLAAQTPSPAPEPNPAPAAPAAPSTPASSENPSVMLLKQGHTDNIRAKAADDLGKQGDRTTIPALADALKDASPKVRREVVLSLADFHLSEVLPSIELATKDADDGVRMTAIQCLYGFYTGNLPPTGWTGFMKKNWQWAASHFEMDDSRIDPGVNVDPTVITTLVGITKNSRAKADIRQATKGLGILLAKSASPDLVITAHSSDIDLSLEALNSLQKIKDRDSGPKLIDLLDSSNKEIKRSACVTVGILGTKDAVAKLQAIFQNDTDLKDRIAALQGLAFIGDKVSTQLFTQALWHENKDIRQAAAEGLAHVADPQSLNELKKAEMAEKDGGAKLAIEFALAALGQDIELNGLVTELGSKGRPDAARAYLIELTRNPANLTKIYPFLQSPDSTIRKRLCVVLMYSGDQSSLPQLDRLSRDPDSEVASTAIKAKRAIRSRVDSGATS